MTKRQSIRASSLEIDYVCALSDNYIWLIKNPDTRQVIAVDPGESAPVIEWLESGEGSNYTLSLILVTHHHSDHTDGVAELVNRYNVPVWGPKGCRSVMMEKELSEGDSIRLFGYTTDIWSTPGHTLDHIVFLIQTEPPVLLSGDTLFHAGCGRLFEGTAKQMQNNFARFKELSPDTLVFGAHEYSVSNLRFAAQVEPGNADIDSAFSEAESQRKKNYPTLPSTIGKELAVNPFMRVDAPSVIQALEARTGQEPVDEVEAFAWLRKWKDNA